MNTWSCEDNQCLKYEFVAEKKRAERLFNENSTLRLQLSERDTEIARLERDLVKALEEVDREVDSVLQREDDIAELESHCQDLTAKLTTATESNNKFLEVIERRFAEIKEWATQIRNLETTIETLERQHISVLNKLEAAKATAESRCQALNDEYGVIIGNLANSLFPDSPKDSALAEFMMGAEGACLVIDRLRKENAAHATTLRQQRMDDVERACKAVCAECAKGKPLVALEPDVHPPMGLVFHQMYDRPHIPNEVPPGNQYEYCEARAIRAAFDTLDVESSKEKHDKHSPK